MARRHFPRGISRRDFVNGTLAGSGAALLGLPAAAATPATMPEPGWYGYGGVGEFRVSHGNPPEVVARAHRLWAGGLPDGLDALPVSEDYDLVIVGAGMAGLGAALAFMQQRAPGQRCLLLDNHPLPGGEAKENEFRVRGERLLAPQGANGFFVPPPISALDQASGDAYYYALFDIPREFRLRAWPADEKPLRFSPDNYEYLVRGLDALTSIGYFFRDAGGPRLARDIWQRELAGTPWRETEREQLLRWYRSGRLVDLSDAQRAIRRLDRLSYEQCLVDELGLPPSAARQADLFLASACGLGSDAVSAWAAAQLPMPGLSEPPPPGLRRNSFPGGNSGFTRCFLKRLIPDAITGGERFEDIITGRLRPVAFDRPGQPLRLRTSAMVIRVRHDGSPATASGVDLVYLHGDRPRRLRARAVVLATGNWVNRHIVSDAPDELRAAMGRFRHAPFLVANLALNNWRFLYRAGITAAIWAPEADGFGFTCNLRQPMCLGDYQPPLDPDRPAVLSFYTPFHAPGLPLDTQLGRGRAELLSTSYADYEARILRQLQRLFSGSGFDPARDVAGLILNRWGHAYSVPWPGFYGGFGDTPPRDLLRRGFGRIAFAHSELAGLQHYGPAADEGRRAFGQLRDALAG